MAMLPALKRSELPTWHRRLLHVWKTNMLKFILILTRVIRMAMLPARKRSEFPTWHGRSLHVWKTNLLKFILIHVLSMRLLFWLSHAYAWSTATETAAKGDESSGTITTRLGGQHSAASPCRPVDAQAQRIERPREGGMSRPLRRHSAVTPASPTLQTVLRYYPYSKWDVLIPVTWKSLAARQSRRDPYWA